MQPHSVMGLTVVAVAAPLALALGGPHVHAPGDSIAGRWLLDRAASSDVRRGIDSVTSRMSFFIRPIARSRLRNANELHDHLTITITPAQIVTTVDRMSPMASPASGASVTWTRDNGDVFDLHTTLTGDRLVQTFVGRDGSTRENVFVPADEGRTLNIAVTVSHPRLPRPLKYRLVYHRDDTAR